MGEKKRRAKWFHICMEVDYLISILRTADNKKEKIVSFDGKYLSSAETIKRLQKLKEKGIRYIPMGDCNNRAKDGSCRGHEV